MKCQCSDLPDAFYLDEGSRGFAEGLKREISGNWIWLGSCPSCGQLWALDEWDKYQDQVVTRVNNRETWNVADTTNLRKQLLLKSRGGLTDTNCIWAGCTAKAVKGVVFCLDHLWNAGTRR